MSNTNKRYTLEFIAPTILEKRTTLRWFPWSVHPKQKDEMSQGIGKGYRNDNAVALFMESIVNVSQNKLSKYLVNAKFYSFLSDGSIDTGITET